MMHSVKQKTKNLFLCKNNLAYFTLMQSPLAETQGPAIRYVKKYLLFESLINMFDDKTPLLQVFASF